MIDRLRDWWRGYSHDDLQNVRRRVAEQQSPGAAIGMTFREYRAMIDNPMPRWTEQEMVDEIFAIRVNNNVPWKRLMEIALKHAPDETRAVLREINANDRAVSDLLGELAK